MRKESEKAEDGGMLVRKVSKPSPHELDAPIVYALEKDELFCFCIDYQKLSTVTNRIHFSYVV